MGGGGVRLNCPDCTYMLGYGRNVFTSARNPAYEQLLVQ